jgi:hypothetical protein
LAGRFWGDHQGGGAGCAVSSSDCSKGERGKFFRPDAELQLPIYLNAELQAYLAERAALKGIPLGEMVNMLLKQKFT